MQPFSSFGVTSICNGEIYNFKDLYSDGLRSDVEVVNHVLTSQGSMSERLRKLDGDFAFFAIIDETCNFVAARDPVGVRPLFYGRDESGIVIAFASEAKALMGLPDVQRVDVFPPGHYWTMSEGFHSYTDTYEYSRTPQISDIHEGIRLRLEAAVKKRILHSDVPVALLCSGGLDSSLILAIASQLPIKSRLEVFSIELKDGRSADALYAGMIASHLGVKHTRVEFAFDDIRQSLEEVVRVCETYDPNTIRAALPMYILARHIGHETAYKVILSGEGADEVFCGYNYFQNACTDDQLAKESERLVRNIHMFDLLRADRCFAAFGLELRVPFLDIDMLRFAMCIPGRLRGFQNGIEKSLLRDAFRNFAALECARIIDRQKERLSDGCGFTYVPQLLTWLGNGASDLCKRLDAEKDVYRAHFESQFPDHSHLITERKLPPWVDDRETKNEQQEAAITI